jgi:hypothetical protein
MRATLFTSLLAVGLVTLAGVAIAVPPKPPAPLPPVTLPKRKLMLNPSALAALRAHKPLTLQEKTKLVLAGRQLNVQPSPEGPFTLSVQNMVQTTNGAVTGTLIFDSPQQVLGAFSVGAPSGSYALLAPGNTNSAALLRLQAAGDKTYLIDCGIVSATTVNFSVTSDYFATVISTSAVTPVNDHASCVIPKLGAPKAVDIWITALGPGTYWQFLSCEITPFSVT